MGIPAVFLDRDGTINVEKKYLYRIEDWEWIPRAIEAIKLINQMGYLAIVVTNQAGVARGYYSEDDVKTLHTQVDEVLAAYGARIDAYYYCPHHPDFSKPGNCDCRKPAPGMLLRAKEDLDIDLEMSYLVGDKVSDIEAALVLRVKPIFVLTGYGAFERPKVPEYVKISRDLISAINLIKSSRS